MSNPFMVSATYRSYCIAAERRASCPSPRPRKPKPTRQRTIAGVQACAEKGRVVLRDPRSMPRFALLTDMTPHQARELADVLRKLATTAENDSREAR